eukprot:scaffold1569_cov79-Isochrysis_galbana.AAC.3
MPLPPGIRLVLPASLVSSPPAHHPPFPPPSPLPRASTPPPAIPFGLPRRPPASPPVLPWLSGHREPRRRREGAHGGPQGDGHQEDGAQADHRRRRAGQALSR